MSQYAPRKHLEVAFLATCICPFDDHRMKTVRLYSLPHAMSVNFIPQLQKLSFALKLGKILVASCSLLVSIGELFFEKLVCVPGPRLRRVYVPIGWWLFLLFSCWAFRLMKYSGISQSVAFPREFFEKGNSDLELESSVWDLLLRAEEARRRISQFEEELASKYVRRERAGRITLRNQVDKAKVDKNCMLLEAFRKAPTWFEIVEDPNTKGYHSLRYKKRPAMKFHFPSSMLNDFSEAATLI